MLWQMTHTSSTFPPRALAAEYHWVQNGYEEPTALTHPIDSEDYRGPDDTWTAETAVELTSTEERRRQTPLLSPQRRPYQTVRP